MEEDAEDGGGWITGPATDEFVAMDEAEPSRAAAALKPKGAGVQKQQAKRGNRSKKQKLRKAAKFGKAEGFLSRLETKTARAGAASASKKSSKGLWTND
jgi:hypothetical protein